MIIATPVNNQMATGFDDLAGAGFSMRRKGNREFFQIGFLFVLIPDIASWSGRDGRTRIKNNMLAPFYQEDLIEAGCDEAGRGCLAGPVYAAAVILPKDFYHPLLNDSKQVTEKDRYELRPVIESSAISYAVARISNEEIDRINILRASFKAMHLAVKKLSVKPQLLLIDGNRFAPLRKIPHKCIIKGDASFASIAAASILAKTYRDDYMTRLHRRFPKYVWKSNKGYGTAAHCEAIEKHGQCKYHRKTFRVRVMSQSEIEFGDELIMEELQSLEA
jgi:ribonuclease HII